MTIDYYISMGSLVTGIVTDSPILQAVPTAFLLTATCFPRLLPLGISKSFTFEEQAKLDSIKNLLPAVCQNLGIKDPSKINLRVSNQLGANACMVGTTSSLGGPVLCLGNTYFKNYEPQLNAEDSDLQEWVKTLKEIPAKSDELEKYNQSCTPEKLARINELSEKFKNLSILKDPEFREWLALLDDMPNTPSELGKYIDSCSTEKRKHIKDLSAKFKDVLSQDELEAMFAHELGHAKHHHLLKFSGLLLLILTADQLAQVFANSIGFGTKYSFVSIQLLYLTTKAISRAHETEADGECATTARYQKGMLKFHKKKLINDLFEKTSASFENKVSEMIQKGEWTSSHPNGAKRLKHAVEFSKKQNHPATRMTNAAWTLVGLGVLSLAKVCFYDTIAIWNATRIDIM